MSRSLVDANVWFCYMSCQAHLLLHKLISWFMLVGLVASLPASSYLELNQVHQETN